jgi:hypothetical protein
VYRSKQRPLQRQEKLRTVRNGVHVRPNDQLERPPAQVKIAASYSFPWDQSHGTRLPVDKREVVLSGSGWVLRITKKYQKPPLRFGLRNGDYRVTALLRGSVLQERAFGNRRRGAFFEHRTGIGRGRARLNNACGLQGVRGKARNARNERD